MSQNLDLIFAYSRQQAIEDGVLIDCSELAQQYGFKVPVAVTDTVWNECVRVPIEVQGQDKIGRLWDILSMLRLAISARPKGDNADTESFNLHIRNDNRDATPPLVEFKAMCHPGDAGEPVITVMFPDED